MPEFDVLIVGGGPAGAVCAAVCARAGLRTIVVERAVFPRDKVCGDCLNPDCWPVLERLELADRLRALPHTVLREVEFISARGRRLLLPLPGGARGEVTIKRSLLDQLLLDAAEKAGAKVVYGTPVAKAGPGKGGGFNVAAQGDVHWTTRFLVAADGRNSAIARAAGLIPPSTPPRRIGFQAHLPCPVDFGARVQMHWFAHGYGGVAPVGGGELNVSLVGPPDAMPALKAWTQREFQPAAEPIWRTIAPLDRSPAIAATDEGLFLVGDAVRVVEPFTGEGIYYALRSGELAAEALIAAVQQGVPTLEAAARYREGSRRLYRGRLWVNRLARLAVLHPRIATVALEAARWHPGLLRMLTAKVVRP